MAAGQPVRAGRLVEVTPDDAEDRSVPESSGGDTHGTWPHQLSHAPVMRVSDVLAAVAPEFPTLSSSKLRFLDTQGLVVPERTATSYRLYSAADVERLRFVLRQQRDFYHPLAVIAAHLDALDARTMSQPVTPHEIGDVAAEWLTAGDLTAAAGVDAATIADLESAGVISQGMPGRYQVTVVPVVVAAASYLRAGGDVRAVRVVRNAAVREADQARAAGAPARTRGHVGKSEQVTQEFAESAIALFASLVRHETDR